MAPYDPSTSKVETKEVSGDQEGDWQYPTLGLDAYFKQVVPSALQSCCCHSFAVLTQFHFLQFCAGSRDNTTAIVAFLRPVSTLERVFG